MIMKLQFKEPGFQVNAIQAVEDCFPQNQSFHLRKQQRTNNTSYKAI